MATEERRRKACQGLRRGFGFPILLIFLFLPPFSFLAHSLARSLSLSLSRSFARSLAAHPGGGCLPLLPVVSPLTYPRRALSAAAAPLDLPYTRPSSQSGVAGSFRASKRIKSYGRGETRATARSLPVPSSLSRRYLWLRCDAHRNIRELLFPDIAYIISACLVARKFCELTTFPLREREREWDFWIAPRTKLVLSDNEGISTEN